MSYNTTYDWKRPLTDFFMPACAEQLTKVQSGSSTLSSVSLPLQLDKFFNHDFHLSLKGEGEDVLKEKLSQNSVSDWKPNAPVRLYHGTSDEIVPFETSVSTYRNFKKNGAKQVELIPVEGGTHGSTFFPMLVSFITWVNTIPVES